MNRILHNNPILASMFLSTCLCLMSGTIFADSTIDDNGHTALSVAKQFSDALGSGDKATVMNLLADDVLIYESGGAETSLEEYASHHLNADMKYLSGLDKELISQESFVQGDLTIITSISELTGTYRDKPVDSKSAESLVMKRTDNRWKIVHIHWSSR